MRRSGGDDQIIVGDLAVSELDYLASGVDPDRFGEKYLCILLSLENVPDRHCDVGRVQRGSSDLVEQGLE